MKWTAADRQRTPQDEAAYRTLVAHLRPAAAALPCTREPDAWTSDEPARQHLAARSCNPCPALEACRTYATHHPEISGVWGGLTPAARRHPTREDHPA